MNMRLTVITVADTCPRPNCHMPLARSRQGRVLCCNCRADVVSNSQGSGQLTAPPAPPAPRSANSEDDTPSSGTERGVTHRAVVARPARDATSAAMCEKLLQGWTMLNSCCEVCATPLLRDDADHVVCVVCQMSESNAGAAGVNHESNGNLLREENDVMAHGTRELVRRERDIVRREREMMRRERDVVRQEHDVSHQDGEISAPRRSGRHTSNRLVNNEEVIDVDEELRLCERSVAENLRVLRSCLAVAADTEARRTICRAMRESCQAIHAAREARSLPPSL